MKSSLLSLSAFLILTTSAWAAERPDPLTMAQSRSVLENRPLEVLVGARWCPECRHIEYDYRSYIRTRGVYVLDFDVHLPMIQRLPRCQTLPALIIWDRDPQGGWRQPRIVTGPAIGIYLQGR